MQDPYGRPWCMLTFLYSPDCVFSAKAAKLVYRIAKYFPKLRVIAVSVSLNNEGVDEYVFFNITQNPCKMCST